MSVFNRLYNHKLTNIIPMQGPIGLAYAMRFVYDDDDSRLLKITIEEYEEYNDNNDRSN